PDIISFFAWRSSSVGQSTRLISAELTVRVCPPPPKFPLVIRSLQEKSGDSFNSGSRSLRELSAPWMGLESQPEVTTNCLTATCIRFLTVLRYFVVVTRLL